MIRLSSDTVLKISNLNSWLREILSIDADELSNKEVLRKLKAESQFFPAGTWEPTVTAEIYSVMVPKDERFRRWRAVRLSGTLSQTIMYIFNLVLSPSG